MELKGGQLVEFVENQKFVPAVILDKKSNRYHCLTLNGKEINISPNRFIHISPELLNKGNRHQIIQDLKEIHEKRNRLSEKVNIPELWELTFEEQELWEPKELAELAFSEKVTPDHEAALIRAVINDHTYFKYRDGKILALSKLVVEKLLEQRKKEAERLRKLIAGGKWLEGLWSENSTSSAISPDISEEEKNYWINAIKDVCLKGDESQFYQEVNILFRQTGLSGKISPFETMVKAGIWQKDENLEILRHEIETEFSEEVLEQARKLSKEPIEEIYNEGREDLTDLDVFTIDSTESRDLDDAISFEKIPTGYEIGVHITDIGLKIQPGTPLFENAISRATTIYLPEQQIPMLPEVLSHEAWSLHQDEIRRALSFMVTVDNSGHIQATQIIPSIIKVKKRLSYQDVDTAIELKEKWHELYKLCKALQARRIQKGALPLPIPELNISVDENGQVHVSLVTPGPARFMVAEAMILANWVAANFLEKNKIPGLFRSQPPPRDNIISGDETALLPNIRQRRLISRGVLSTVAEPHAGLGLPLYTTVTSPLRRALDLIVQQQLSGFLLKGKPLHTLEDLERILPVLKQGLATAAQVNQGTIRYWLIKYFQSKKQDVLKAWVIEIGQRRLTAVLQDTLTTFELPIPQGLEIRQDQEIEVKVREAKPRENILKFTWADHQLT